MGSDELKERIKRRVYLPDDEDEYDTISKPLTGETLFLFLVEISSITTSTNTFCLYVLLLNKIDIILDDASTLSGAGNDLKGGFISDVTT